MNLKIIVLYKIVLKDFTNVFPCPLEARLTVALSLTSQACLWCVFRGMNMRSWKEICRKSTLYIKVILHVFFRLPSNSAFCCVCGYEIND